jgi:hypothetical protein
VAPPPLLRPSNELVVTGLETHTCAMSLPVIFPLAITTALLAAPVPPVIITSASQQQQQQHLPVAAHSHRPAASPAAAPGVRSLSSSHRFEVADNCAMPQMRPERWTRTYSAPAVDAAIKTLEPRFRDHNLGRLFANTLPNALDSTVIHQQGENSLIGGKYDTFIVTGDIDAMWQRDSTNQAKPYLRFLKQQRGNDTTLTDFFRGLIARQAHNTLLDPYANAFQRSPDQTESNDDDTKRVGHSTAGYLAAVEAGRSYTGDEIDAMIPGIYERKYELDSLANVLDLAAKYYDASGGDLVPFDGKWLQAVDMIMRVMTEQQKSSEQQAREQPHELGPYNFGERARSTTRCTPAPPWHATARWKLTLICTLLAVHGVCRTQGARRRSPPTR